MYSGTTSLPANSKNPSRKKCRAWAALAIAVACFWASTFGCRVTGLNTAHEEGRIKLEALLDGGHIGDAGACRGRVSPNSKGFGTPVETIISARYQDSW